VKSEKIHHEGTKGTKKSEAERFEYKARSVLPLPPIGLLFFVSFVSSW